MSDPITLVRWRRADTDPPRTLVEVWTDRGGARMHVDMKRWVWMNGEEISGAQPSWWCDPVPPGDDPLTMDNWESAVAELEGTGYEHDRVEAARLRRAIEEAERLDPRRS